MNPSLFHAHFLIGRTGCRMYPAAADGGPDHAANDGNNRISRAVWQ